MFHPKAGSIHQRIQKSRMAVISDSLQPCHLPFKHVTLQGMVRYFATMVEPIWQNELRSSQDTVTQLVGGSKVKQRRTHLSNQSENEWEWKFSYTATDWLSRHHQLLKPFLLPYGI